MLQLEQVNLICSDKREIRERLENIRANEERYKYFRQRAYREVKEQCGGGICCSESKLI